MSTRAWFVVALIAPLVLILGAATLWQSAQPGARDARVLLLNPRTGETLRERSAEGGYAVAALLGGGRVAVAAGGHCPEDSGGSISVLDPGLRRVLSARRAPACDVAVLDPSRLRSSIEGPAGSGPKPDWTHTPVTVDFGANGHIVESGELWFDRLTAYDASGRMLWQRRQFDGHLGHVDARAGRIVVTVLGSFADGGGG